MKFRIEHYEELDSTNSQMLTRANDGEEAGLVISTDFQTHGRGKLSNQWESPRGENLLFSLLIRPKMTPQEAPMLTQITCKSVAAVLEKRYNLSATFKRPNDILIDGKKICGILVESSTSSKKDLDFAIVGIGLNVNSTEADLIAGATSIKASTGEEADKKGLLEAILEQFKTDLVL